MYQFDKNQFAKAAGTSPLALVDIDNIPEKLLMAAIQLHETGQVDQSLLLDKSVKDMIDPAERRAIKRGELRDDMEVMEYLDQIIDMAAHQDLQHQIWQELQKSYPVSLKAIAAGIESEGTINHSKIFGDAFADEHGNLRISGEKLSAIRYGTIDPDDSDYVGFLDRVDVVREHMKAEEGRYKFFDNVTHARNALQERDTKQKITFADWQAKLEKHAHEQVVSFADFAARADMAAREMFVTGPDAKENQALLGKAINATVAASLTLSSVPDAPATHGAPVEAAASLDNAEIRNVVASEHCNTQEALFFDGKKYNFVIDDPKLCAQLLKVIPAKGETLRLNESMSLKANHDGSYRFMIETTKTRAECLRNAPSKYTHSIMTKNWAQVARTDVKGHACLESVVKDNLISSRNMNAMMEAWLYSGGQEGTPVPFTYFMAKWFLESRHGNLTGNPTTTAFGMNQFVAATWADQIIHRGQRLGDNSLRERLVSIAEDMGISRDKLLSSGRAVQKLSKNPEVRALHRQYAGDAYHSAVYGADYSLSGLLRLQAAFKSGDIPHPAGKGRTEVTSKMGYACHLLGFEGCKALFTAYGKNPDKKVSSVVKDGPYERNDYLFEARIYKRDKDGEFLLNDKGKRIAQKVVDLTMREFFDYLETFGFDDTPMEGLAHYKRLGPEALAQNQPPDSITFLTVEEAKGQNFRKSETGQVGLEIAGYPKSIRQVLPLELAEAGGPEPTKLPALTF